MEKEAVEKKIEEITRTIVEKFQPEKIILFGSWAWGKPTPDSDVDLLVVKDTDETRRERERKMTDVLYPAGIAMDILVYTPAELEESINRKRNLFLEDIVHNGRVLFTKPEYVISLRHQPAEIVL